MLEDDPQSVNALLRCDWSVEDSAKVSERAYNEPWPCFRFQMAATRASISSQVL